ncbi:MAG: DegV family protein [Acutalibacteraceae bacterium]|nr:DegV family protein [Acutalibacteraceae bacterium]
MAKKVLITSDSTTDLSPELIERYNVKVLPLGITLGSKTYRDGIDINPDIIYENYNKTGELPKTSAVNIDECINFFASFVDEGYAIVHFSISSEMSSTFNNCRLAAQEFEDVYVVDTKNLSTGGGLMVISAAEMAEQGLEAKDISEKCNELASRIDASFIIDNLEFLHKGGRCSAIAALGANLLKLKPCVAVRNGKMGVIKKYRGKFETVLLEYIKDMIGDATDIELDHVFVTHAGCEQSICDACIEQVKSLADFKEIHFTRAGSTVSAHCGKNTLGVLFIRKSPLN